MPHPKEEEGKEPKAAQEESGEPNSRRGCKLNQTARKTGEVSPHAPFPHLDVAMLARSPRWPTASQTEDASGSQLAMHGYRDKRGDGACHVGPHRPARAPPSTSTACSTIQPQHLNKGYKQHANTRGGRGREKKTRTKNGTAGSRHHPWAELHRTWPLNNTPRRLHAEQKFGYVREGACGREGG